MQLMLAKNHDAPQVYTIVQETIKVVYPKYYLKEIVDMFCEFHSPENITKDIEAKNTYILMENKKIIGTGTKNENHITRVYVLPQYQKKGYGTFLGYQTTDHGIWECKNGVIQVYEIMKKELINTSLEQLILRPYKPKDAEAIVSWIKDEKGFRKWRLDMPLIC